ncbi:MAG: hypothetical protein MZV70_17060 [Desulfobacterales bacterium]|nr:hypothetical protein [Desulfobacterales bacterium]
MALVILRELGVPAVPLLYPLLGDKDSDIVKFAVDLLRKTRSGVDPLIIIPSLRDLNPNAVSVAGAMGDLACREAVPFLIDEVLESCVLSYQVNLAIRN